MSNVDLYDIDLTGVTYAKQCGGNTGNSGTGESCIEYAEIPGQPGAYAVRDTKLGPDSPVLRFTPDEFINFRAGTQ